MKHQITLSESELQTIICKHIGHGVPHMVRFYCTQKKSVNDECVGLTATCEWEENENEGIDNSWAW